MPSAMIAKPAYPYLCRDSDRHGRVRYRLRVPGRKAVTIKGQFGSAEFAENYRVAVQGTPVEKTGIVAQHGSMAALARSYLRSGAFAALSPRTQRARRYLVEQFVAKYGDCQSDHGCFGSHAWNGPQCLDDAPRFDCPCYRRRRHRDRSYCRDKAAQAQQRGLA